MSFRRFSPRVATVALVSLTFVSNVIAQRSSDAPDLVTYGRIREEGTARSRVMDYATGLVDGIGPRLTGSPNLKRATAWALDTFKGMGLSNVRTESWGEFGLVTDGSSVTSYSSV